MKTPKCKICGKRAEYYVPDENGNPKMFLCEEHAREYLLRDDCKLTFLPRIKEK